MAAHLPWTRGQNRLAAALPAGARSRTRTVPLRCAPPVLDRVRAMTLDRPVSDPGMSPAWVSRIPNHFNAPERPGTLAASAFDAAYTMAPYFLKPHEALVIEGAFGLQVSPRVEPARRQADEVHQATS